MNPKNLRIACGLIGIILILALGFLIILPSIEDTSTTILSSTANSEELTYFDNSTPKATAISIARLNEGANGFKYDTVNSASLTSDGKYWIVKMSSTGFDDWTVTVDPKTLMSKSSANLKNREKDIWVSFDELKAVYIAEIQSTGSNGGIGKPSKVTIAGKEVWKVPVYYFDVGDGQKQVEYVYVNVKTGKSKNELYSDVFNEVAGDNWLTLKQVDDTINKINKMYNLPEPPFRDALRELYSK